jgi:alpha-L-glutamate ligase-like protein
MSLRDVVALWRNRGRVADVVGINRRNVELVYAYNRRPDYPLVDDKIVCKQLMESAGVAVPRTIAVCDGLYDIRRALASIEGTSDIVVKPANGSGGDGILVLREATPRGWRNSRGTEVTYSHVYDHLANIVFGAFGRQLDDRAFIEERIVADPFFEEIYPRGLSDVRLIFLKQRLVMSMIRLPTDRTGGRANLHLGGVGIGIDEATGMTTRAVVRGELVTRHPDTGAPLVGRAIPAWERLVEVGRRAAGCVPLGYLGVDIVLDAQRGPLVLEMNARPGLEIQNVNGRPLGPAVREALHES